MIYMTDPHSISPYLKDASNYMGGCADKVVIPESIEELRKKVYGDTTIWYGQYLNSDQ